jgi:hypothetical protein
MIRLTELMILSEPEPNQDFLKEVHDIYDYTDDEMRMPLAQLEMLVSNKKLPRILPVAVG